MRLKGKSSGGKREGKHGFWKVQVKSVLLSLAVVVVVLSLASMLVAGTIIPEKWLDVCALIAALSGVIAGVVTARISGVKSGALYGMSYAAAVVLLCVVSGVLLYGEMDWMWCGVMGTSCLAGGGAAGAAGVQSRKKRR